MATGSAILVKVVSSNLMPRKTGDDLIIVSEGNLWVVEMGSFVQLEIPYYYYH